MGPDFKVDPSLRPAAAASSSSHLRRTPSSYPNHTRPALSLINHLHSFMLNLAQVSSGHQTSSLNLASARLLLTCFLAASRPDDHFLAEGKRFLLLAGRAERSVASWPTLQASKQTTCTPSDLHMLPESQVSSSNCSICPANALKSNFSTTVILIAATRIIICES